MIHRTEPLRLTESWQKQLSELISTPEALIDYLNIDDSFHSQIHRAHKLFPIRTTRAFADKIKPNDLTDPLLRQILPIAAEHEEVSGYTSDPLLEVSTNTQPGVIHKYQGRVLLITAPQCAINCRYCFRRHFDYKANSPSRSEWLDALEYIRADASIDEVILSGGDPLVLSDTQLEWLVDQVTQIEHIQRLRIHSRIPIVLPARITSKLLNILTKGRLETVFVVHCNHPQEIDEQVEHGLKSIREKGLTLLNQSVLLRGINDQADILIELSKKLFSCGTLPYYLHVLDKVKGAAHFDVKEQRAIELHLQLLSRLPGYLVPKLVREDAQAPSKVPIV